MNSETDAAQVQGVLLDVDGTLVLSNDAHAHAWVDAFAGHGYSVGYDRARPLMGMGGDHVIPTLVPGLSSDEGAGKQIADERREIFLHRYAPELRPAPGARDLVARMQRAGLRVVVATSAHEDELERLLQIANVDDLLHETTSSSETASSKPAPDVIEVALKKLGVGGDSVVMIGDTPYDIESAGKAGIGVIAVRCGGFDDRDLASALGIYDDPADLVAHYADSPLGRGRLS